MADEVDDGSLPLPQLGAHSLVWRLAGNKQHFDPETGQFSPAAFFLRVKNGQPVERGLSVNIGRALDVAYVKGMEFQNPPFTAHAAAELSVGQIWDIDMGLTVEADSDVHADIVGVPSKESDLKRATDIAHLLADIARTVWVRRRESDA